MATTILVVDDDPDLREAICESLADHGFATLGAAHGRDALRILRDPAGPRIGLVLLDLMMPVMSGWEFREEQLRDAALVRIPVAVMTAAANLEKRPIVADAVLRKPTTIEDLLRTVRALLGE